jgi:hypothetical protein
LIHYENLTTLADLVADIIDYMNVRDEWPTKINIDFELSQTAAQAAINFSHLHNDIDIDIRDSEWEWKTDLLYAFPPGIVLDMDPDVRAHLDQFANDFVNQLIADVLNNQQPQQPQPHNPDGQMDLGE